MIPSKYIRNVSHQAPILNLMVAAPFMEKVMIKNIYQQWRGETITQIRNKHTDNPYTLRIGTPNTDKALANDSVLFIQSYMSYNPVTKSIEKRELIPYRNVEKVYIGEQRIDEEMFGEYASFINGNVVVKDLVFVETKESLSDIIAKLTNEVANLRMEVAKLKSQTQTQPIYK
tara:strand:+ start:269 stop:787 length:519 start_codon:yes stop_codon:yes gene_type:complete